MSVITPRCQRPKIFAGMLAAALVTSGFLRLEAQETKEVAELREPVYRVTKQDSPLRAAQAAAVPARPLDAALEIARSALNKSRTEISDYTCIVVKRERIGRTLGDEQFMMAKIRNEKREGNRITQPFSVYIKFLKPSSVSGREVIYVAGRNSDKLIAHEGGWKGRLSPSLSLDPNGTVAMMGQRYPITDIGVEKLCVKLLERGTRDRELADCSVEMQAARINDRPATRIQVTHLHKLPQLDFHVARIFVDDELGIPVRYEAYDWPAYGGEVTEDELIEEYTYIRLQLNPGLTDDDFDPANKAYNMK